MLLDDARETELRELVERLDRLVPKDGAHLAIQAAPDTGATVGNRLGYLRFGIAFLAAALHPLPGSDAAPPRITPNLDNLVTEGSETAFALCELDESIGSRPPARSRLGAPGQVLAGVVVVVTLILLFIGASVVWRWVFG
jgi:hypothetical protein